jgi:pimeloyl-ACP methyl ester carboxylesterase
VDVPADTAALLIYNMMAVKDYSAGLAKMNRPILFAFQASSQGSADYLKAKFGDKVKFEQFEGVGHALFVDDPEKFNRVVDEFAQSLGK